MLHILFFLILFYNLKQNIGCETAQFLAAFGNEDPGVEQIANRLFTLPDEAL